MFNEIVGIYFCRFAIQKLWKCFFSPSGWGRLSKSLRFCLDCLTWIKFILLWLWCQCQ